VVQRLSTQCQDPFGSTPGERVARRLAGAGTSAVFLTVAFAWSFPLAAVIGLVGVYVIGLPLSWALERLAPSLRRRDPTLRYALAGRGAPAGVRGTGGVVLARRAAGGFVRGRLEDCGPVATVCGAIAAASAYRLPRRWVMPAAIAGIALVLVFAGMIALTV
jgi:hypothetical protein